MLNVQHEWVYHIRYIPVSWLRALRSAPATESKRRRDLSPLRLAENITEHKRMHEKKRNNITMMQVAMSTFLTQRQRWQMQGRRNQVGKCSGNITPCVKFCAGGKVQVSRRCSDGSCGIKTVDEPSEGSASNLSWMEGTFGPEPLFPMI
jgi:hypothetical protein